MRLVVTGGGTGGHVYPALAVVDEIRRLFTDTDARAMGAGAVEYASDARGRGAGDSELDVIWIGSMRKEAQILPKYGIELVYVDIIPFKRSFSPKSIAHNLDLARNLLTGRAVKQAGEYLSRFKPDCLISTGGYVAYPACIAAVRMGIPLYQIEPNASPGLVTRKLAMRARTTFCASDECAIALGRAATIAAGVPVRDYRGGGDKQTILRKYGIDTERKTVLVAGGSLGARFVNNIVFEHMPSALLKHPQLAQGVQILHQVGKDDYEKALAISREVSFPYKPVEYIDEMPEALSVADLFIGRSGASTVAEVARFGIPAIFIPYAHHKDRQQVHNALPLVNAGVALMHRESDFDADEFEADFVALANACRNQDLRARIREFDSNAAEIIAKAIIEEVCSSKGSARGNADA